MIFTKTDFPDLYVIEPKVYEDSRGCFFESFNLEVFSRETGLIPNFVQDNQSTSSYGALRGMHFQKGEFAQAKLVRVLTGSVYDVVVDLRPRSPMFKRSYAIELSCKNRKQLFVPRGFAHSFVVLSETAVFYYKCDNYYNHEAEGGINYADPELNIDWIVPANKLILSEKDKKLPFMSDL